MHASKFYLLNRKYEKIQLWSQKSEKSDQNCFQLGVFSNFVLVIAISFAIFKYE